MVLMGIPQNTFDDELILSQGLVSSATKPLPDPLLTQIYVNMLCH